MTSYQVKDDGMDVGKQRAITTGESTKNVCCSISNKPTNERENEIVNTYYKLFNKFCNKTTVRQADNTPEDEAKVNRLRVFSKKQQ